MVDMIASPSDLAVRQGKPVPAVDSDEYKQMESHLQDASAELASIIGQPILRRTSTVTLPPDEQAARYCRLRLPAYPVVSVSEVSLFDPFPENEYDGSGSGFFSGPLDYLDQWFRRNRDLYVPKLSLFGEITVTFTHGYVEVPTELVKWACVLAASSLTSNVQTDGGLGMVSGLTQHSQSIDDYQESWGNNSVSSGGGSLGMTLPADIVARLQADYGAGGVSVIDWR